MSRPRSILLLGSGLMLIGLAGDVAAAAEPPQISKPRPAPPGPANVPQPPPAYFDPTLSVGGEDVKARKESTRLSVDVQVNGRGPYHFIVDSGADTSVVGLRIARDLQLPLGSPAILNGMTSRNVVDRVKVAELTLGPSTVKDLELPALREIDMGGDGIVGIDALVHQRLMMDFDKRLIKVEDARRPPRSSPDEIVITAKRQRGQLILTEVRATGLPLDAVIDTGSEITIGNVALRNKLIRRKGARFWTVKMIGVTGQSVDLDIARIDELQLGPVILRDVPIAFADVPPFKMFGLSDEPSLLLGTDILENFRRVSLDFRARKVRFQLRRCTEGIILSTSQTESFTKLTTASPEVCGRS